MKLIKPYIGIAYFNAVNVNVKRAALGCAESEEIFFVERGICNLS